MADLKAPGKVRPHGESFTIEICDKNQREKTNLQDSFLKFKKAKQREIRTTKKMKKKRRKKQRNPEQMQKLREKFIEKAKKYYGVPYARKYWPPESEEYQSKLFLDCCGLVRQVVRDLSKDFGFHIGPWNQAYMYDTLPITIENEQDMKPGDLVFMSGIYPNPKARQQKHNMTHVEIWAGEGKKTIGARWNSGKVQMWDSYQFEAKSFHSAQYYFKSIDTWLLGVCKSFCPEHKWKRRKFRPEKKSIFKDTVSANDVDKTQTMKTKDQKNEENQVEKIEDIAADETEDVDKQDDDIDSSSSVSEEGEDNFCSDSDDDDDINASPDDTENEQIESSSVMESRFSLVGSYPKYYQRQQIMHGCSSSAINKPRKTQSAMGENEKSHPDICILKKDSFYQSKAKPETLSHEQLDLAMALKNNCDINDRKPQNHIRSHCSDKAHLPANPKIPIEQSSDANLSQQQLSDFDQENNSTSLEREDNSGDVETEKQNDNNQNKEEEIKLPKRTGGKKSPGTRLSKPPACSLPNNMQPTFYVGGGNGVALVEGPLLGLGWKRTVDKYDERYRLKWTECKTRINYGAFKEGEQLVNHIPNCQLLTNKLGLLNSLQEYERVTLTTKGRPPRLRFSDFVPETFRFDERNDRDAFLERYADDEMWICKPTGLNQGKGIFLIRDREELNKLIEEREQRKEQLAKSSRPMMTRIVQKYIPNPLLLDGRKFDIRAYMLIASTTPYLVLYHKGYVRLCCNRYNQEDKEMSTHLTNQYVQKKDPAYKEFKENTAWSMDKFNDYINEQVVPQKEIEEDWVYNTLTKQMQKIMIHCFNSVKHKLQSRVGFFELYGLDFMVDTDMKVWLIEINVNPALHVNCEALKEVIPGVVEESLYLSIECFEKTRKNQTLLPLNSLKGFSVLYCGTRPYCIPARTSRSVSPTKDMNSYKTTMPNVFTAPVRRSSPIRTGHRMSTASTPVITAKSNTGNTQDNRKNNVSEDKNRKSDSQQVANTNARQNSSLQQENVKLKMIQGDGILNSQNPKEQNESKNEKNINTSASGGIVLNLTPTVSSANVQGQNSATSEPVDVNTSDSASKNSASDSVTTAAASVEADGVVNCDQSNTSTATSSQLSGTTTTTTQSNSASVPNSSTTTLAPPVKTSNVPTSGVGMNPTSAKQTVSFPVITNNGVNNKNSKNSANHQSATSKSPKEGGVKNSTSGGLSSNPYSLTSSSLAKLQNASVYLSSSVPRTSQVSTSASMSNTSVKLVTTTAYSKPLSIPSVTISDSVVGPKTIATLTLTSSKNGPHGRNEVKSSQRRSRDRDKPDRGN